MKVNDFITELKRVEQLPTLYKLGTYLNTKSGNYYLSDCSGLVKGILWGYPDNGNYGSNGVSDLNANTIITKCSNVSTDFSNIEVGEFVWLRGHCGVYIGNSQVIESSPKWENGVQVTTLSQRNWKKHGKLPWVDYSSTSTSASTSSKSWKGDLNYYLENDRVGVWQKAMNKGFDTDELSVDNKFGIASQNFAKNHILWFGQRHNCPTAIKWLQTLLRDHYEFYNLDIDGKFGSYTEKCIKEFQSNRNITADGKVGLVTTYYLLEGTVY